MFGWNEPNEVYWSIHASEDDGNVYHSNGSSVRKFAHGTYFDWGTTSGTGSGTSYPTYVLTADSSGGPWDEQSNTDGTTYFVEITRVSATEANLKMRTGSHDKIAFTDKNVKENYLCHWGRDGLTGFKSLVKICSQPTNEETLAVDHKKITCPTAVFWALHDAWMPKESGERLKQDIAGPVRLQFIERAGHWSQEDRPDEVAAMIEDFITEWEGVNI